LRILLTGATGYIGSRVAQALAARESWRVTALARPDSKTTLLGPVLGQISLERCDGTFQQLSEIFRRVKPDIIVHTAASNASLRNPERAGDIIAANVTFGAALLEAMVENGTTRFVNTGTFWEEMDGDGKFRPIDLYAASKRAFQNIMRFYEDAHGLHAVTLKLFGVYGPGDPRPKVFSLFKKSSSAKEPVAMSPGLQKMDLIYVDDVAEAYVKAVEYVECKKGSASETFDIGTGVATPLKEIARIYEACSGERLNILWGGIPYRAREAVDARADIAPAKEKLKWKPTHQLKSGISRLLNEEKVRAGAH